MNENLFVCKKCIENLRDKPHGSYIQYRGFFSMVEIPQDYICPKCKCELTETSILVDDARVLTKISNDTNFIESMIELHDTDIIEYESKMSQFRNQVSQKEQHSNIPKCPTCNSTNIQKISGTKRFVTTGLFGLASSNVGKTMECKNCGAKW